MQLHSYLKRSNRLKKNTQQNYNKQAKNPQAVGEALFCFSLVQILLFHTHKSIVIVTVININKNGLNNKKPHLNKKKQLLIIK